MSLQNLSKKNNYELFCKKITVDEYEIDTIVVDNIVVDNATVLTQVTTPHINSGTSAFNTVATIDLDAVNGTIENLTVGNTATVNALNVNTTVTAPNIITNNISSPNGNISNLLSSVITAPSANLDNISGSNLSLSTVSGIPSTPLNFYYYDNTGTVTMSGAINSTSAAYRLTRIGKLVSFQLLSVPTATCTNNASPIVISGIPSIVSPPIICRGLVSILNGATPFIGRWNLGGTTMQINAGLSPTDYWTLGNICSIAGGSWNFQWVL